MKRYLQVFLAIAIISVGARTWWIFHERSDSSIPEKPGVKERNEDDYVYLRPSHAHDVASARAVLKGQTVWVKAGNAVAYFPFLDGKVVPMKQPPTLPPLAELKGTDVILRGNQMYGIFEEPTFGPADHIPSSLFVPPPARPGVNAKDLRVAVPIGIVRHGDATIVIDDIFFLTDPHKLYSHWSKDAWASVERHEITQGMSEMQAQAAMGMGRVPESGTDGDYGNRTLVFTDPAHPDKPVTVHFADNAAVSVSK